MHGEDEVGIRYMFQFDFPPNADSIAPGPRHVSIEEALEASEESGTRSILDVQGVSDEPAWLCASPLSEFLLVQLFGTREPSRDLLEAVLLKRSQIVFVGYSFD